MITIKLMITYKKGSLINIITMQLNKRYYFHRYNEKKNRKILYTNLVLYESSLSLLLF